MNFIDFKNKVQAGKENKIKTSSFIYRWQRKISVFLSWLLIKIWPNILPNHVSIFNVILLWLLLISIPFWPVRSNSLLIFIELILLSLTSILDKVDGEIARYKNYFTQSGLYFDLLYHFSYAFIFYIVFGYYFSILTNVFAIFWVSVITGLFSAIYHMLGKLRHHIEYKIKLEGHTEVIKDIIDVSNFKRNKPKLNQLFDYAIFLIYDWVWFIYFLFSVIAIFNLYLAKWLFIIHLLFTILRCLYELLWIYPKRRLFQRIE